MRRHARDGKTFSALKIERNKREFISIHDHNESARAQTVLDFLRDDKNVAYASDAGMPAISDPGARLVDAVLDAGLTVTCIPGPSAVAAAVALSGFESTAFSFFGFFPRASKDRTAALARLNAAEHTSVFYESPQRLSSILALMATTLDESRRVVVCRELTKKFEEIFVAQLEKLQSIFQETLRVNASWLSRPASKAKMQLAKHFMKPMFAQPWKY